MASMLSSMGPSTRVAIDAFSVSVVGASLISLLPPIATVLTIIWMAIRVWETDTIKTLCGRGKKKRRPPSRRRLPRKKSGVKAKDAVKKKRNKRVSPKKDNDLIPKVESF